jgi:hypothetical protein
MPTPFEAAGQQHTRPIKYAPLFTDRYFTGLWTNRNPLRDAATSFVLSRYGNFSRFESLLDGLNVELTTRLTLARRPGLAIYNSQTFGEILNFYSYIRNTGGVETIQVIAQDVTAGKIYNATGPNTKAVIADGEVVAPTAFLTIPNPKLGSVVVFQQRNIFGFPYFDASMWDGTTVRPWGVYASGTYDPFYTAAPFLITESTSPGTLSPTVGYKWAYSYYNDVTGDVSNVVGNIGSTYVPGAASNVEFNLTGPSDESIPSITTAMANKIIIWRTLDGGSTYFYLTQIANPNSGTFAPHSAPPWTFVDNTPDDQLNEFGQAPVALDNTSIVYYLVNNTANSLTLTGRISAMAYHLGLTWVAIGNTVYYSRVGSAVGGVPIATQVRPR